MHIWACNKLTQLWFRDKVDQVNHNVCRWASWAQQALTSHDSTLSPSLSLSQFSSSHQALTSHFHIKGTHHQFSRRFSKELILSYMMSSMTSIIVMLSGLCQVLLSDHRLTQYNRVNTRISWGLIYFQPFFNKSVSHKSPPLLKSKN